MSDQVTAREVAESVVAAWDKRHGYPSNHLTFKQYGSLIDAITAALAAAVAGETERCAKVAESLLTKRPPYEDIAQQSAWEDAFDQGRYYTARAIRARPSTQEEAP